MKNYKSYKLHDSIRGFGIQRYNQYWCVTLWNRVYTTERKDD